MECKWVYSKREDFWRLLTMLHLDLGGHSIYHQAHRYLCRVAAASHTLRTDVKYE